MWCRDLRMRLQVLTDATPTAAHAIASNTAATAVKATTATANIAATAKRAAVAATPCAVVHNTRERHTGEHLRWPGRYGRLELHVWARAGAGVDDDDHRLRLERHCWQMRNPFFISRSQRG
jgi:hypothetical protein